MHEKSRPGHTAKKPSKTVKEKRAAKRATHETQLPSSLIPPSHPRHPQH